MDQSLSYFIHFIRTDIGIVIGLRKSISVGLYMPSNWFPIKDNIVSRNGPHSTWASQKTKHHCYLITCSKSFSPPPPHTSNFELHHYQPLTCLLISHPGTSQSHPTLTYTLALLCWTSGAFVIRVLLNQVDSRHLTKMNSEHCAQPFWEAIDANTWKFWHLLVNVCLHKSRLAFGIRWPVLSSDAMAHSASVVLFAFQDVHQDAGLEDLQ